MEWIDVNDRLPDIGQYVIGFRPNAYDKPFCDDIITILQREGVNSVDHLGIAYDFERAHHVTHWMPLPEVPKQ